MLINKKEIIEQLIKHGVDHKQIKDLHLKLQLGEISYDSFVIPDKRLSVPNDKFFDFFNKLNHAELKKIGEEALKKDELLIFWLNGGAATRYFANAEVEPELKNLPKGITPAIEGMSYLELKIRNLLKITADLKLEKHPWVLLMNSFLTDEPTKDHLGKLFKKYPALIKERFHFVVQQPKVPRFKKVEHLKETDLYIDQKGHLSFAPSGHGDFLYLTREYLKEEKITGVKYMFFNNIDNFGSYIDPAILGYHIQKQKSRTVEVAEKSKGDKGGAPCLVDCQMQIVEQMKFPIEFNQDSLKYFNTNNFWFTLNDLLNYEEDLPLIIAEKKIAGSEVLQLEHFACDVNLPSNYLVVPRQQRFWPTKNYLDLQAYLQPDATNPEAKNISQKFKKMLKDFFDLDLL